MARENFERSFSVAADTERTWEVMTDVERLVGWISILEQVETIAPLESYRATLKDRIGMFALRADVDIVVSEMKEFAFLKASAEGEDRQIGSRILVDLEVALEGAGSGTDLRSSGSYEITGKVATLGSSAIRRKADKILEEFFTSVAGALA